MKFKVIDKKTGKEADVEEIALHEDWAKDLIYCDIEGFAITEDGELILADECGKYAYCPDGRFEVQFDSDKALEEKPHGEWIYGEDEQGQDGWFCSECDFFVPWYYGFYKNDINFIRDYKACPHCLAEMITYTGKDRKPPMEKKDNDNS